MNLEGKDDQSNKPIFVQALWRTSSTYTLSKFRELQELRCYTKPFHHDLEKSPSELQRAFENAAKRHSFPFIDKSYYDEFEAKENGVPEYNWEFSTQDYVLGARDEQPAMESYLANLIAKAKEKQKRPMMQFNRGVLRASWLQERFGATSLYISRSPLKMLESYKRLAQKRQQYYMACYLGILGQNSDNPLLAEMADYAGAPMHQTDSYRAHFMFYNRLANALPDDKARDVVGFFWSLGILSASKYAATTLDMELQIEQGKKTPGIFHDEVKRTTGLSIDFSDLNSIGDEGVLRTSEEARKITRNAANDLEPDIRRLENFPLAQSTKRQLTACLG